MEKIKALKVLAAINTADMQVRVQEDNITVPEIESCMIVTASYEDQVSQELTRKVLGAIMSI